MRLRALTAVVHVIFHQERQATPVTETEREMLSQILASDLPSPDRAILTRFADYLSRKASGSA